MSKNSKFDIANKNSPSLNTGSVSSKNYSSFDKADNFLSIVIVIFTILFIVSYVRSLTGASEITFTSFLEFIQTVPEISFANSFIDLTILGDWGIFDFLRNFLNVFTNIFSVLIYLFGGLVQLLTYLVYLLRYLFLV